MDGTCCYSDEAFIMSLLSWLIVASWTENVHGISFIMLEV